MDINKAPAPLYWVKQTLAFAKYSLTFNGAMLIAVPVILTVTKGTMQVQHYQLGILIGCLAFAVVTALMALINLTLWFYDPETGPSIATYLAARDYTIVSVLTSAVVFLLLVRFTMVSAGVPFPFYLESIGAAIIVMLVVLWKVRKTRARLIVEASNMATVSNINAAKEKDGRSAK